MNLLIRWGLASAALLITIYLVPGLELSGGALWVLVATLALGLLNVLARPALFLLKIVTLPLSCITLGLWAVALTLFVNALLFYFVGSLGWGFTVDGIWSSVLGALVMSAITAVLTGLLGVGRGGGPHG